MLAVLNAFRTEADPLVQDLRTRRDEFYRNTQSYASFEAPTPQPQFWAPVRQAIEERLAVQASCRVLEFGAGCTGFRSAIADLSSRLVFHVQDVTPQNLDHLRANADEVFIQDLRELPGQYDVIFSTFVWEHITTPQEVLRHVLQML